MKSPRTPDNEEPAAERACDFRPVDKGFTSRRWRWPRPSAALNCKKPFCVEGCPVNINIPLLYRAIREKDFGGALGYHPRGLHASRAICGRVCPQENQCEASASVVRSPSPWPSASSSASWVTAPSSPPRPRWPQERQEGRRRRLARPASLRRRARSNGFDVTVLEAFFTGGGVLVYGIPGVPSAQGGRQVRLTAWRIWASSLSTTRRWQLATAEELFERASTPSTWQPAQRPAQVPQRPRREPAQRLLRQRVPHAREPDEGQQVPEYDTPPSTARTSSSLVAATWLWTPSVPPSVWAPSTPSSLTAVIEDEMPRRRAELHHAKAEGVLGSAARLPARVCRWRGQPVCAVRVQEDGASAILTSPASSPGAHRGRHRGDPLRRRDLGYRHQRQPFAKHRRQRWSSTSGLHRCR